MLSVSCKELALRESWQSHQALTERVYAALTNFELPLSVCHSLRTQKTRGKVCAYTSPANFMPQLMRVSYIRRVRARLSCGV